MDLLDSFFSDSIKIASKCLRVPISTVPADDSIRELEKIIQKLNFSKNLIKFIIIEAEKTRMVQFTNY